MLAEIRALEDELVRTQVLDQFQMMWGRYEWLGTNSLSSLRGILELVFTLGTSILTLLRAYFSQLVSALGIESYVKSSKSMLATRDQWEERLREKGVATIERPALSSSEDHENMIAFLLAGIVVAVALCEEALFRPARAVWRHWFGD